MSDFANRVYEVVKRIPKGKVATYKTVAILSGYPRAARGVGRALHFNPKPIVIPCHRVINSKGELSGAFAFGGVEIHRKWLESDGVIVDSENRVDLKKYLWNGFDEM